MPCKRIPQVPKRGAGDLSNTDRRMSGDAVVTPLETMIAVLHQKIPITEVGGFVSKLRRLSGNLDSCFSDVELGTACSGSDIIIHVLTELFTFYKHTYGITLNLRPRFACELDPEKRAFLQAQFDQDTIYENVTELGKQVLPNMVTGRPCHVPATFMFCAGFSCKTRSKLNKHSSAMRNCIQYGAGEAETTQTWIGVQQYLTEKQPRLVLLENVKELTEAKDGISDADHIIKTLQGLGYVATYKVFDSGDYGSIQRRLRLYFFAWFHGGTDISRAERTLWARIADHSVSGQFDSPCLGARGVPRFR